MTCLVFGTNRVEAETTLATKQAVVAMILPTPSFLLPRIHYTTMPTILFPVSRESIVNLST